MFYEERERRLISLSALYIITWQLLRVQLLSRLPNHSLPLLSVHLPSVVYLYTYSPGQDPGRLTRRLVSSAFHLAQNIHRLADNFQHENKKTIGAQLHTPFSDLPSQDCAIIRVVSQNQSRLQDTVAFHDKTTKAVATPLRLTRQSAPQRLGHGTRFP